MARGETVSSLRAYFLVVAVLNILLNGIALFDRAFGLHSMLALAGIAVGLAFGFLGLRLKSLITTNPQVCTRIVIGSGLIIALVTVVNLFVYRRVIALAQAGFWLLVVWYLVGNLERLASGRESSADPRSVDLVANPRLSARIARVIGWGALGLAAVGALATLGLLGPIALQMLSGPDLGAITYVATGFMLLMPLVLCAVAAYFGLRMLQSASGTGEAGGEVGSLAVEPEGSRPPT